MVAPAFLSATALARRIRTGRISASDALERVLERQSRFRGALNAVVVTEIDSARKAARAVDRARARGASLPPLAGVPITVKESFDVAGLPTTWGLEKHRANIALANAVAVQRLMDAGAIVWGKTNVPVLLADWQTHNPVYGTTCNPWDTARTPGGSSGGAAAALAAGLTHLDYGSDIGGSIRAPAHYCGVYGHKSTFGIVPTVGHALPDTWHPTDMSVVGPLARSASDLKIALRLTARPHGAEAGAYRFQLPRPTFDDFRGMRVAVVTGDAVAPVSTGIADSIEALARFLVRRRARVTLAPRLPYDSHEHHRLYVLLRRAATAMRAHDDAAFARLVHAREALDPGDSRYSAEQVRGNTLYHREWLRLSNERHRLRLEWQRFFDDYDVLLCPAAATTAFPRNDRGERWERVIDVDGTPQPDTTQIYWMGAASVSFLPATVAPIEIARDGLPVGVQIVGPQFSDLSTIRFAALLERHYHAFQPPPGYD